MVCLIGHIALGFNKLNARIFAETEVRSKLAEVVDAEVVADGVEIVVARVADSGRDVFLGVGQVILRRVPDPALRRVAFGSVPCVDALALYFVLSIYYAHCERGYCRAGFESRTGGVGAHQRAVKERGILRFEQLLIVLQYRRDIVGRPARHRKRLAGLNVHDHGGSTGNLVLEVDVIVASRRALGALLGNVLLEYGHAVCKDTLGLLLQDAVDRQVHMVAGLRLLLVYRREHRTGGISRLDDLAVLAVEVIFKGVLDAVLTDHGVGRIVQQRVFLILLLSHKAGVAKDMRGVFRAVLTAVCTLDLDADELVFHDRRDELHARVLDENIVGSIDGVADVYRVTHAGDDAHLLGGVAVVDIISRAHIAHQLDRRGVRVYLLTDIVRVKHRALDSRHVRVVLERRSHGYGQVVGIFIAVALDHVHKLEDDRVRVIVCKELVRIYLQVVGLLIADEGTAVAVIDIAARSGHYTLGIRKLAAAVVVCLALYDLELIKRHQIHRQEQQDEDNKPRNSARFYKSVVHCKSFPLLDPLCRREICHRRKRQ